MNNSVSRRALIAATGTGLTALFAGCSTGTERTPGGTEPTPGDTELAPGDTDIQEFVERDGTSLQVDNSQYQYTGMMALLTHTAGGTDWTDRTMRIAQEYNIDVFRCWGFPSATDEAPAPHQEPGEFDDTWFEQFDYTVAKAKESNVRLIVPLLQGVHYDASVHARDYTPSPVAYATWSDTTTYTNEPRDFLEDEQATEYFKEYIEYFLTRENQYTGIEYRNEPTILMWECANEIEAKQGDDYSIASWYDDVASYIKSIDSNHLVSTGMHGSMGQIYEPWTERCAYVEDHNVDAIDVCSFHDYPIHDFGDAARIRSPELAARYARHKIELAHNEVGKPVYCGEYGCDFMPDVETEYLSTIETAEQAAAIESNEDYPMAYPEQFENGVLTTRKQDSTGVTLQHRRQYFQHLTGVAEEYDMDGVQFWRLLPDTSGESASDEQIRQHRKEQNPLAVYPADTAILNVIQEYHTRVS